MHHAREKNYIYIHLYVPGPSNRSQPATFKSTKASKGRPVAYLLKKESAAQAAAVQHLVQQRRDLHGGTVLDQPLNHPAAIASAVLVFKQTSSVCVHVPGELVNYLVSRQIWIDLDPPCSIAAGHDLCHPPSYCVKCMWTPKTRPIPRNSAWPCVPPGLGRWPPTFCPGEAGRCVPTWQQGL